MGEDSEYHHVEALYANLKSFYPQGAAKSYQNLQPHIDDCKVRLSQNTKMGQ